MRFSLLCLPFVLAAVACSGDTSYAGPASSLTVLGGNAASPAGASVAHFEAPRSIGTPKAEVVRIRHSGVDPKAR
jgi:hypothetical protein